MYHQLKDARATPKWAITLIMKDARRMKQIFRKANAGTRSDQEPQVENGQSPGWLVIFLGLLFSCGVVDSISNFSNNLGDLFKNALSF